MARRKNDIPKMPLLGEDASGDTIRRFVNKMDMRECKNELGEYVSPINGKTFSSYYGLMGHIGAYLTERTKKPPSPDRSGYIRSIRNGIPPTEEQRRAHREYMRAHRQRKREEQLDLQEEMQV